MYEISEKQKKNIISIIENLKHAQTMWMNHFTPDERNYIIYLIKNQSYKHNYNLELNANFTKFRKIKLI